MDPLKVYLDLHGLLAPILTQLEAMEVQMSALTDAIEENNRKLQAMKDRIDQDVTHLRELLDQALATDVADQAVIDALRAEADAAVTSIKAAGTGMDAIDPDASFPPAPPVEPPPVVEPPVVEPPVEPPPAEPPA